MRKSDGTQAISCLSPQNVDWKSWIFEVKIRGGGQVKLNVLHVAIIMRNMDVIEHILQQVDIKPFVDEVVAESDYQGHQDELEDDDWIYGATVLHLAARFYLKCLQKLIATSCDLINNQENRMKYSPLHVAGIAAFQLGSRILLLKGAEVDAKDKYGRTPLFFAAKSENYLDVVTLVEEGGANIYEKGGKDEEHKQAPFNVAKSSDILKFFFSKITPEKLIEADPDIKLFEEVADNHPTLIEAFLNIFIDSEKKDIDGKDNQFKYDLSLFTTGDPEKKKNLNLMHRHVKLIESENTDMLLHPIMRAFTDLKWLQFFWVYLIVIVAVFLFLVFFTWHGYLYVDFVQCEPLKHPLNETCGYGGYGYGGLIICADQTAEAGKDNNSVHCDELTLHCRKKSWRTSDQSNEFSGISGASDDPDNFTTIIECFNRAVTNWTRDGKNTELVTNISTKLRRLDQTEYAIIGMLAILIAIEISQFAAKKLQHRTRSYFSFQNILEILIIIGTICYLQVAPKDIELGGHIGGWTVFFAWMNFTAYLCQVLRFGRAIYSSIHVTKKILKALFAFIPSLVGFASAFHFFLHGNDQFHDFSRSILKVVVMMLGEYDFEGNFTYTDSQNFGGRGFSVQFMFFLFTIYASVIIMNLLVALMVNQMNMEQAEALLQTHRVEEISDKIEESTIITNLKLDVICQFGCQNETNTDEENQGMNMKSLSSLSESNELRHRQILMKVDKEKPKNSCLSRRPVLMEPEHLKECRLDCRIVKCLNMLSISDEVAKATLETLRRKRDDQLKMVREIKEIQHAGTEKMAKYAK